MIDLSLTKFPKVTVILRGYNYEQVRCVVKSMVGTKLGAVEVAMNTPGAAQTIEKVVNEFGDDVLVGAGTVISAARAYAAAPPSSLLSRARAGASTLSALPNLRRLPRRFF